MALARLGMEPDEMIQVGFRVFGSFDRHAVFLGPASQIAGRCAHAGEEQVFCDAPTSLVPPSPVHGGRGDGGGPRVRIFQRQIPHMLGKQVERGGFRAGNGWFDRRPERAQAYE